MKKIIYSLLALSAFQAGTAFARNKPQNVIFILVDDMQKTAIQAYGNSQVQTLHID